MQNTSPETGKTNISPGMGFINIENLRIAYFEKNPQAKKVIFFIHGNSCSSRMWYRQFQDQLFAEYRMIAFDLPGHGYSDPARKDEDYNLLFIGKILAKAVNALAPDGHYILTGLSLGANIVAEMMNHEMNTKGIVLISPTIVGGAYTLNDTLKEGADCTILFSDDPTTQEISAYVNGTLLSNDQRDASIFIEDFSSVKQPFRSMILKTSVEGKLSNEVLTLTESSIPIFMIFGIKDTFVNYSYLDNAILPLWNNKIYKLDNAGHFLSLDQPVIFNDLLINYCKQMFK